jgi:hypothetical protein
MATRRKRDEVPGQSEAEFMRDVFFLARLRGWRVAHFRTARIQRKGGSVYYATPVQADGKGFPDAVLVRAGRVLAVEFKAGKNKTTRAQEEWLDALARAGVETAVWRPEMWSEIEAVLGGAPCSNSNP